MADAQEEKTDRGKDRQLCLLKKEFRPGNSRFLAVYEGQQVVGIVSPIKNPL
jgi:hypothetical protein